MRVKLTLGYDGTNYCGWQVQPNGVSVQQKLEEAISALTGQKVKVTGSGRTDAGVHAEGQTAHFDIDGAGIPAGNYADALNTVLPPDIRVYESQLADDGFDARKSAKKKTYRYSLYKSRIENPLKERYALKVNPGLNVNAMISASKFFIGEHDFRCFKASGGCSKTTVRTVYDIVIEEQKEDIFVSVTGNGFLYNMVRILVGTLIAAGEGRLSESDIVEMLESGKRSLGGKTLPAKGLCLKKVEYQM